MKRLVLKKVRIHHTNGLSYDGLLNGRRAGHYVLQNPSLVREESNLEMGGELLIPKENVHFIQVLGK
jgi:hypothetical protein